MPPRCPICELEIGTCTCDPKDQRIAELEANVTMLEKANAAWQRRSEQMARQNIGAELRVLANGVAECGGMERFQAACTPNVVLALLNNVSMVNGWLEDEKHRVSMLEQDLHLYKERLGNPMMQILPDGRIEAVGQKAAERRAEIRTLDWVQVVLLSTESDHFRAMEPRQKLLAGKHLQVIRAALLSRVVEILDEGLKV